VPNEKVDRPWLIGTDQEHSWDAGNNPDGKRNDAHGNYVHSLTQRVFLPALPVDEKKR